MSNCKFLDGIFSKIRLLGSKDFIVLLIKVKQRGQTKNQIFKLTLLFGADLKRSIFAWPKSQTRLEQVFNQ